jgi:heme exporter protein B
MTATFRALIARDLRLSLRHGAESLAAVMFFALAAALFPLGLGPAPETLARTAAGIVWVTALLAALLPLERLFGADFEDGTLDQLLLSGLGPTAIALAKTIVHWLLTGLPLLLAAGPLAIMLHLPQAALPALLAGLALGTATLSLIGSLGAAIILGARRGGTLLPLLTLPLAAPILIFGAASAEAAATSQDPTPHLLLLAALLAATTPTLPLATAAALRTAAHA